MDCRCATKRKAEDDMCNCATKRKLEQKAPPPSSCEGHGGGDVEAPKRHMTRLSQEKIGSILSRTKHDPFLNPYDRKPNPFRSPEDLEENRELYRMMNESYDSYWESFSEYQAWVRSEFAAKGFVEVYESSLAEKAQNRAEFEEEWAAMLEELDLSGIIIGEDDDYVIDEDEESVGDDDLLRQEDSFI